MKKKLCSCGFPQSSPIPHEHDRKTADEWVCELYYAALYKTLTPRKWSNRFKKMLQEMTLPHNPQKGIDE